MRLFLARHGNTFGPEDIPVWVGGRDDLPLVQKGEDQAASLAVAFERLGLKPARILHSPLQRTARMAEIIAAHLDLEPRLMVDERLREIDYGAWALRSSEEIAAEFGMAPIQAWTEEGLWPQGAGWQPDEATIIEAVQELAWDLAAEGHGPEDSVLIISSNGILRYFLTLVDGAFAEYASEQRLRVATGSVSVMGFDGDRFQVLHWNLTPQGLVAALSPAGEAGDAVAG